MTDDADTPATRLYPGVPVEFSLALDHGQFFVLDRGSEIDIDAYDADSQTIGLAQFSGAIVVFTESHWSTNTRLDVNLVDEPPTLEPSPYDHVVLAGIACPSGELRIFSPEETGAGERAVSLTPGTYGVILRGAEFGRADEYGDHGADRYELWLWPTADSPPARPQERASWRLNESSPTEGYGHSASLSVIDQSSRASAHR